MNLIDFKLWLLSQSQTDKVISDMCSRIKRIESVLINYGISSSLDEEYKKDGCVVLLNTFYKRKSSPYKDIFIKEEFPILKQSASAYRNALKLYIRFLEEY